MRETVVLVPGVGMGGVEMILLGRHLERSGYEPKIFWHQPWHRDPSESAARLHAQVAELDSEVVHLVGHSMGGVAILRMLRDFSWQRPGRVVTLASPHGGFRAVRRLHRVPGGKEIAGRAANTVRETSAAEITPDREVGGIAGDWNIIFGSILAPGEPSDSLVAVRETVLSGMRDHAIFHQTHASMLANCTVWHAVEHFLKHGSFPADASRLDGPERSASVA